MRQAMQSMATRAARVGCHNQLHLAGLQARLPVRLPLEKLGEILGCPVRTRRLERATKGGQPTEPYVPLQDPMCDSLVGSEQVSILETLEEKLTTHPLVSHAR